ncbi:SpaH/EbpB family LPXTG-anchored major pilin [Holdemanella sp. MSK.7.32]|uniref:SpaH/EbpB family LPXTG-anchored major pilin n=1 Tax=Holdemanella sp. MSK.7.32 TaxID=2965273 RepID=UPI00210A99E9|nr:SpaH/EbpB family LPXTG-anchored major pilin [Holdemanella sp. MSK.7.32]MCQ4804280.1 SpaH/EbpB family LPXTG-anchored major pilin [Holdemanella sp. MSK.7.32]
MKLIKKIAAIMFALMMVVSMSSNVKADEGTTVTTEKGIITINNAVNGQTYTIYKLLDLESYEPKKNEQGEEIGNYSYKPNTDWNDFISEAADSANIKYFDINKNGYVTWNGAITDSRKAEFAQKALAYATTNNIGNKGTATASNNTVTFDNLDLGYYLVDSSVGALCGLNTTNSTATIEEKNGVPSVEKKIVQNNTDVESNFANIGETINFKTTITAQKGAQSYVLHDTMEKGFTFNKDVKVKVSGQTNYLNSTTDYEVVENAEDKCTFDIKFKEEFLKTINDTTKIEVTYSATLNGDAEIHDNNDNTTHLTYGEKNNTTTSTTHTITYGINVLKYTGDTTNTLANAKFSLYDAETNGNTYKLVQKTGTTNYRLAMTDEAGITEITTTNTGMFSIQGLKPGTYWLEETAAPKGYNKLAKRIKVEINNGGNLIVDNNDRGENNLPINQVNVENKTGTVLPSTGGAGTTMIYLIGGALVLGSGVVLVTKRRVKGK